MNHELTESLLSMFIMNMSWRAKVMGVNLTRTCFFFKRETSCFKLNCRPTICLLICCRLSCHFLDSFFFCGAHFSLMLLFVFDLLQQFVIFTCVDFVFPLIFVSLRKNPWVRFFPADFSSVCPIREKQLYYPPTHFSCWLYVYFV